MGANCFVILTGGTLEESFVEKILQEMSYSCLICVDGALEYAYRHNVAVDYIIGDFDTIDEKILENYETREGENAPVIVRYPPEKDAVDTQLAIELAMEKGAEEIVLLGATGTRLDHTLANIEMLRIPLQKGVQAYILNKHNRICLVNGEYRRKKSEAYGKYLSVLPYGDEATGVTLAGVKYETVKQIFRKGDSLGISNEIVGEEAVIRVEKGILLIIESND